MAGRFDSVSLTLILMVMVFLQRKIQAEDNTPPYITWPSSQEMKVIPTVSRQANTSNRVEYVCSAAGSGRISYTWRRNGGRVSRIYAISYTNGSLVFPDFNKTSNGMYQCIAQNVYGTALSDILHVYAAVEAINIQPPSPVRKLTANKGKGATIAWGEDVPETLPQWLYRWYQDTDEMTMDRRVGVDTQGNLHFAYTTIADGEPEYFSALAPVSGYGTSIQMYSPASLQLVDNGYQTDFAPEKASVTENGKAVIGQEFILDCFFNARPIAEITWKNTSNQIIKGGDTLYELLDYGRKLRIKYVRQEDEGLFKCTGSNKVAATSLDIPLNVTSPPMRVADSLSTHTVPDRRNFTLKCKTKAAQGESLNTPVWYRDGRLIRKGSLPDPSRYSFNEDMTELLITGLDKVKDTASYQCNVSNSEGYLWLNGYFRVIESIVITKKPPGVIYVKINDTVGIDITVDATGDSCCQRYTQYYYNNTELSEYTLRNPPFRYNSGNKSLMFVPHSVSKDVLKHWMGSFGVRVSNSYDEMVIGFTLAEYKPHPAVAGSSSHHFWWIILLSCIIFVLIIIVIILIIYKRKTPSDTYKVEEAELKRNLNPKEELRNNSFKEV